MKPICPTAQIFSRERFRSKLEGRYEIVESGCWEWTAKIDRYGYGAVSVPLNGKWRSTGAHRASWMVHRGPLAPDMQIDHLCRNRKCINPWHLEPVTTQENTRRGIGGKGFSKTGRPRVPLAERKTCGKHGMVNGKWRTRKYDGYTVWICRVCERERIQRWHQKQRRAS